MYSTKYTHLRTAAEASVPVPPLLYLTPQQLADEAYLDTVQDFCKTRQHDSYIVRSAVIGEDGQTRSYAGYFKSSAAVAYEHIAKTIADTYQENLARAKKLTPAPPVGLLIMPFVESQIGGVLFAPWLYFDQHALIEFADTPQQAVAGEGVHQGLLSLTAEYPSTGDCTALPSAVVETLRTTLQTLRTLFDFQLDLEWIYDGKDCYIVQIRPVTIAPSALYTKTLPQHSPLCYTLLSETFGKLSPLSYSLLTYLYAHAESYWNTLSICGGDSFLVRASSGNILVDTTKYKQYYSNQHWYSSLARGFTAHTHYQALEKNYAAFTIDTADSLKQVQTAFDAWQSAIAVEELLKISSAGHAEPFEYELSHTIDIDRYPQKTLSQKWKVRFLETLLPLRQTIQDSPHLVWSKHLPPILSADRPPVTTRTTQYMQELEKSLYTYIPSAPTKSLSRTQWKHRDQHPTIVIANPEQWIGPLPKDKVIVTPRIPQHWIAELPQIQGIKSVALSALSHTAITLREHNIPTAHISQETFEKLLPK